MCRGRFGPDEGYVLQPRGWMFIGGGHASSVESWGRPPVDTLAERQWPLPAIALFVWPCFFSFFVGLGDWLPASFSLSELSQGLYLIVLFLLYRVPGNTCCTETRECLH